MRDRTAVAAFKTNGCCARFATAAKNTNDGETTFAAGARVSLDDFVERASIPLISRLATPLIPDVHDIWADGDTVIIRFDGSATTTSGTAYENQFVWIFRMRDGRVTEAEAFLDLVAYQDVVDNNAPRID